jgi:hypothetical protein
MGFNRRVDKYLAWEKQMQEKYGQDEWLQKVTDDEWYNIEKLTQEEQDAYKRHLELKADAVQCQPEMFLTSIRTTQENVGDGEILKATGLTPEELKIVKAHPLYGLFELVEMGRYFGTWMKQQMQDARGRRINDFELEAQSNKRYNKKAISLIKRLLTTKTIQEQFAE